MGLWQCPNCGQTLFSSSPPDLCDFCGDLTTWRYVQPMDSTAPPPPLLRLRFRFPPLSAAPHSSPRLVQMRLPLRYHDE